MPGRGAHILWRGAVTPCVVAALALAFVVAEVPAGYPPPPNWENFARFFVSRCPEGCRDVDMLVSCGGRAKVQSCTMAPSGDVRMECADGVIYSNGPAGCSEGLDAPRWAAYWSGRFELWTVVRFMRSVGDIYGFFEVPFLPSLLLVSLLEGCVGVYLTGFAVRFLKVTRAILGAVAGLLLGILCVAVFNAQVDAWYKASPIIVLAPAFAVLSVRNARFRQHMCGVIGFFGVAVVQLFEVYTRKGWQINKTVFWVCLAACVLGGGAAYFYRRLTLMLAVVVVSATLTTAAFVQLAGPHVLGGDCVTLDVGPQPCGMYGVEIVFTLFAIISALIQAITIRVVGGRRRRRQAAAEDQDLLHGPTTPIVYGTAVDDPSLGQPTHPYAS